MDGFLRLGALCVRPFQSICEINADLSPGSRCHTVLPPKRTRLPTMSTIELVDPELRDALALWPQVSLTAETLTRRRADALALLSSVPTPDLPNIATGEIHVESAFGAKPIRVLIYRPVAPDYPLPVIVHIHGGGFVMGTPEMKDVENRLFASELKCAIYSVDYRLAPEAPHPAPLEDIYSVFVRALAHQLQEQTHGGTSRALRRRLQKLAVGSQKAGVRRDPGIVLKTGTRLVRHWRGHPHTVLVREDGFEYEGQHYRSLTVITERITGAHWSGPRFFGLTRRAGAVVGVEARR